VDEIFVPFVQGSGYTPEYRSEGAAGADLKANIDGELSLLPGQRLAVPTGLRLQLPPGFEAQVRPRSGLAIEHGVTVLNAPGTVDSDYRGEVRVILVNLGSAPFTVRKGDRIAQLVVAPAIRARFEPQDGIEGSARGDGGFGSTGL
jgi:dUTP pyrophosphatase